MSRRGKKGAGRSAEAASGSTSRQRLFRRTEAKIVLMAVLVMVLLLGGTLATIYLTSYQEIYQANQEMLEVYVAAYAEAGNPSERDGMAGETDAPAGEDAPLAGDDAPADAPDEQPDAAGTAYELSTFYSVLFVDGEVTAVDDGGTGLYSEDELEELAQAIVATGKDDGTYQSLVFVVEELDSGTLVVMMDNTLVDQSITSLFKNTVRFGTVAVLVILLLAAVLARQIVKPLQEAYARQRQFVSDAGHELKRPVAAIATNLDVLEHDVGSSRWLDNIRYENDRMGSVVRQLLELARTENVAPELARLDLSELVTGELLAFEAEAFERGHELTWDHVEADVWVNGNADQLKELVSVLLDNAVEHATGEGPIEVTLGVRHGKVVLAVTNPGEPIPADQRDLIFERFYRADESRSGDEEHYGLGLAIAKGIAEQHGGTIFVDCANGRVTFRITLPTEK